MQRVGQQLEIGQHAGQRGAQLVRRVGDEAALAGEHLLGLAARRVQLTQHSLERARELADLVVGWWLGDRARRVAGACDLLGGGGELGDRLHRAAGDHHAGQQRQGGAGEHPQDQEQLDAGDRRVGRGERATVLDPDFANHQASRPFAHLRAVADHAVAVDVDRPAQRGVAQRRRVSGSLFDHAGFGQHPDDGRMLGPDQIRQRRLDLDVVVRGYRDAHVAGQFAGGRFDLAIEVRTDAVDGQRADRDRERAQDRERQQRRDAGQLRADRQPIERLRQAPARALGGADRTRRGGRSQLPGSCAGDAARPRPRACGAGSRRTPRSCSWSRTGRSPTPRRADAGGI